MAVLPTTLSAMAVIRKCLSQSELTSAPNVALMDVCGGTTKNRLKWTCRSLLHKVEYKETQHILNEQYIKNALRENGDCIDLSKLSIKYGEDGITDIELIAENEEDDGAIIFHTEDGDAGTLDMLNSPDQLKINEYIISTY